MIRMLSLCLLLLGSTVAHAAEPSNPKVEAAREALRSDPGLVQELERAGLAVEAWQEGVWCDLLQPWRPPLVRLWAVNAAFDLDEQAMPLQCPQRSEPLDPVAIRQTVLGDSWNRPEALTQAFWNICDAESPPHGYDVHAIGRRLSRLDADNAMAHLLPILSRRHPPDAPSLEDRERRAALAAAADATRFELYHYAGAHATYLAIADHSDRHPMPGLSPRLESAFGLAEIAVPNGPELTMLMAFFGRQARALPGFGELLESCAAYAEDELDPARADCLTIAGLLEAAPSMLAPPLGQALVRRMERPDIVGAEAEQRDPERWRRELAQLVVECERPRILAQRRHGYAMPDTHFEQFVRDLESLGEREAHRRAATREYAEHPNLFHIDPENCRRVHALDDATRKDLAELWIYRPGADYRAHVEKAMKLVKTLVEP